MPALASSEFQRPAPTLSITRAEMELNYREKFDYNVYNYNLDDAQKEVNEIIKSELVKGE